MNSTETKTEVPLCLICDKPVPDYVEKRCCSGIDCGCMGQPIEPCVCSQECYDAIIKGIGKPIWQRRSDYIDTLRTRLEAAEKELVKVEADSQRSHVALGQSLQDNQELRVKLAYAAMEIAELKSKNERLMKTLEWSINEGITSTSWTETQFKKWNEAKALLDEVKPKSSLAYPDYLKTTNI